MSIIALGHLKVFLVSYEKYGTLSIYSRFFRPVTARGSCNGPVTVGPTKIKAYIDRVPYYICMK